ncbi:hypothetical protein C0992_002721 [Termitomyces sp. T32_za158]|nr:hypothetical protein C0992_002721 [Termitomyces sp. T32_za158]
MDNNRTYGDSTGTRTSTPLTASTNNAAKPTDPHVVAAELKASGKVDPSKDDESDSSLSNPETDDDDRRSNTGQTPHVVDNTPLNITTHDKHALSGIDIQGLGTNPDNTQENQESLSETHQEQAPGESSRNKGKTIDPRNWGDIEFDNAEMDPQI